MSESDVIRQLRELAELHAAGQITDAEYAQLKGTLLGTAGAAAALTPSGQPTNPQQPTASGQWASAPAPAAKAQRFCRDCGSPLGNSPDGGCVNCGVRPSPPPPVGTGWSAAVPGQSWGSSASGVPPLASVKSWVESRGFSSERLVRGDWRGAVVAVLGGLGAMVVVAVLCVVVMAALGSGISSGIGPLSSVTPSGSSDSAEAIIGFVLIVIALAVGGSVSADTSAAGVSASGSVDVTPLGMTLIGFGVLALLFVRGFRGRGQVAPSEVLLQAVRTWLVLMPSLLVLSLLSRAVLGASALTPNVVATLSAGSFWLAVTLLAVIVLKMPEALPPQVRGWLGVCTGPLVGAGVTLGLFSVFALVGVLIKSVVALSDSGGSSIVGIILGGLLVTLVLLGPNVVVPAFGLGLGAPVSGSMGGMPMLGSVGGDLTLFKLTDASAWFWLLPIGALASVLAGGVVAALHAPSPVVARNRGWHFGIALAFVLAFAAVVSSISISGSAGESGTGQGTGGLNVALAFFVALLWGLGGGYLGAALAPSAPVGLRSMIRSRVERAQQRIGAGPVRQPPVGGSPAAPGPSVGFPAPGPVPSAGPAAAAFTPPPAQQPSAAQTPNWWQSNAAVVNSTGGGAVDLPGGLRELAARHAAGEISDQEYAGAKARLLGQ